MGLNKLNILYKNQFIHITTDQVSNVFNTAGKSRLLLNFGVAMFG